VLVFIKGKQTSFSSKSQLNGKKSTPSLGSLEAQAFTNTTVSPHCTRQDPFACSATFPIVTLSSLPLKSYINSLAL